MKKKNGRLIKSSLASILAISIAIPAGVGEVGADDGAGTADSDVTMDQGDSYRSA